MVKVNVSTSPGAPPPSSVSRALIADGKSGLGERLLTGPDADGVTFTTSAPSPLSTKVGPLTASMSMMSAPSPLLSVVIVLSNVVTIVKLSTRSPSRMSSISIESYAIPEAISRPMTWVFVSEPVFAPESPALSTTSVSPPRPPLTMSSAAMPATIPPGVGAVLLTTTRSASSPRFSVVFAPMVRTSTTSFSVPVSTTSSDEVDSMVTWSSSTPVSMAVVPGCVSMTVMSSAPSPLSIRTVLNPV